MYIVDMDCCSEDLGIRLLNHDFLELLHLLPLVNVSQSLRRILQCQMVRLQLQNAAVAEVRRGVLCLTDWELTRCSRIRVEDRENYRLREGGIQAQ